MVPNDSTPSREPMRPRKALPACFRYRERSRHDSARVVSRTVAIRRTRKNGK